MDYNEGSGATPIGGGGGGSGSDLLDFDKWWSGDDALSTRLEQTKHPLYKHSTFVFLTFLLSLITAMAVINIIFAAHIKFSADQRRTSWDDLKSSLVGSVANSTESLSNACFSCTGSVGEVHSAITGKPLSGTHSKWRFKGRLLLKDSVRNRIQFPNGGFLGHIGTIFPGVTDVSEGGSYVQPVTRLGQDTHYFAKERRLSTWTTSDSNPPSTLSIVPETFELTGADTTTGSCIGRKAQIEGNIYGAFKSSGPVALCTCIPDTSSPNTPPTEYCMSLTTNNPA